MPKLERKGQKVFGETGPEEQFGKIGSGNTPKPIATKDIDEMQELEQFSNGYFDIVSTGLGKLPYSEDFNSLFHLSTRQIAYIMQAGIAEWHSGTQYYAGVSIVQHSGELYIAIKGGESSDQNINQTPQYANDRYWKKLIDTHPAGSAYIQFPGFPAPDEIGMLGTWQHVSHVVAGDFIRFDGGQARVFNTGRQPDQLQDHRVQINAGKGEHNHGSVSGGSHSHSIRRGYGPESDSTEFIATRDNERSPGHGIYTTHGGSHTHKVPDATLPEMTSDSIIEGRVGSETRPVNITVRLWKRIL